MSLTTLAALRVTLQASVEKYITYDSKKFLDFGLGQLIPFLCSDTNDY